MSLIDKIRAARELRFEVGGHAYTIRRPTDLEMAEIAASGGLAIRDTLKKFVVGWDCKEIDLIPGGDGKAVEFDADVFAEFIEDRPDDWGPLANAIKTSYEAHVERRRAAEKN